MIWGCPDRNLRIGPQELEWPTYRHPRFEIRTHLCSVDSNVLRYIQYMEVSYNGGTLSHPFIDGCSMKMNYTLW